MAKNVNEEYPGKNPTAKAPTVEELKMRAIDAYEGETARKHDFPTEIVELPSKGLLYAEGSTLQSGKVEMKYMTAKEEDILTTQSYIKQGIVLDKLFQSLIISNGEGQKVKYSELLLGDKNAIMIAARVLGYGKDYECTINTPSGDQQKEVVDLAELNQKEIDYSLFTKGQNRFTFKLPNAKRDIEFKFLCGSDEPGIEAEIKAQKKFARGVDSTLSTRLMYSIISVDGDEDRMNIRKFVQNSLLAMDSRALRKYMRELQPDVDLNLCFDDNATGEEFFMDLPIDTNFFWPGA
tara:strand:- start:62 stop:940 length:879 start_codon:yes stop_codon:yes gene_type:complete